MTAPSTLIVDDGELDSVQALLERQRVDWVRCCEPGAGIAIARPRDLILSSGPRTMSMPALEGEGEPLWVCLYDEDFLPLRERLCALGVHYLVSAGIAPETLSLFVRQLLHTGAERRRVRRIPLRRELEIEAGAARRAGTLLEVSKDGCVFACDAAIPEGRRVVLRTPAAALTGDASLVLPGEILRANGRPVDAGGHGLVYVFRFGALDGETVLGIEGLLTGGSLDGEVTPLRAEPGEAAYGEAVPLGPPELPGEILLSEGWNPSDGERRRAARRGFARRVDAIRWQGEDEPVVCLGSDLSTSGLRLVTPTPPRPGSEVTLALSCGGREEPLLVDGEVVRSEGDDVGVRFLGLAPAQRLGLKRLLDGSPRLEQLVGRGGSVCVAELVES